MGRLRVIFILLIFSFGCDRSAQERHQDHTETDDKAVELVKRLYAEDNRGVSNDDRGVRPKANGFEATLMEIIKHGRKAEKPLSVKLTQNAALLVEAERRLEQLDNFDLDDLNGWAMRSKAAGEVFRLGRNLGPLTALRRVQQKPDPLAIEIIQPRDLKTFPGRLPPFSVKLKSVDVDKMPVWTRLVPHFHGTSRESQWRFEVRNSTGDLLPIRPNNAWFSEDGGIASSGWLRFGDYIETILHMGDFIDISEPGEYSVTLAYHPWRTIADIVNPSELNELLVFRSNPFKLTLEPGKKRVIRATASDSAKVMSLVAALPNEGVVKIVGGVYDVDDHEFVQPDSPAGQILMMNWNAVPGLLELLTDKTLSLNRKAWVFSLLYSITAERELNPIFSGAMPDHEGIAGKNTLGTDCSGERQINPRDQEILTAKWLKYRDEFLVIQNADE